MAGEWMQIDCDLPEKREVINIMCATGSELDATIGRLIRFWRWVERHFSGPTMLSANVRTVSALCGGDENFWKAVEHEGWISFDESGVTIPGYIKRFSKSAKRRSLDARRKSANRPQGVRKPSARDRTLCGAKRDLEKKRIEESPLGDSIPALPPLLSASEPFMKALERWLAYKREKRQAYKPEGLSSMVGMAVKRAEAHGVGAVVDAMEKAMANGWQGWDQANSFGGSSGGNQQRQSKRFVG